MKNLKRDVIAAREHVGTQDIDRNDGERAGDLGEQSLAFPGAKRHHRVALLRANFPGHCRSKRLIALAGKVLEEPAIKFQMIDNLSRFKRAEIIVRHEIEMRFDFFGVIGRQFLRDFSPEPIALDFRLFVIRLLIDEILRGGVKKLPDERFLPIRPRFGAGALTIGEREQHERVQVFLVLHDVRHLNDRCWVVEVSLLRDVRESEMVVDQKNERLALLGR